MKSSALPKKDVLGSLKWVIHSANVTQRIQFITTIMYSAEEAGVRIASGSHTFMDFPKGGAVTSMISPISAVTVIDMYLA